MKYYYLLDSRGGKVIERRKKKIRKVNRKKGRNTPRQINNLISNYLLWQGTGVSSSLLFPVYSSPTLLPFITADRRRGLGDVW